MANQNTKLEIDLFEELSDADLMTVVGGTLTTLVISQVSPVVGYVDKTTNFDQAGEGISAIGNGAGDGVGAIGGFVTAD